MMSVLISDENYKEYMTLQHNALFQQKMDSVRAQTNLKNDIDNPIRNLVAMFALLGCKPLYSCCGFDYDGQPMHKTHEYGSTYIRLSANKSTADTLKKLSEREIIERTLVWDVKDISSDKWIVWATPKFAQLMCDFDYETSKMGYPWAFSSCIHFYEYGVIRINYLESAVKRLFISEFADEIVLKDTNKLQPGAWQYPVLEDWIIKKEEILG